MVALPDHSLLDRVIRGRFWIPLLGVMLAGIVAMQVEVLKLNAGIGRALERGSALQAQNEQLQADVAQLSDVQRIERYAAAQGMVMAAPQEIGFLRTGASTVQRAVGAIGPADPSAFAARVAAANAAAGLNATGTAGATGAAGALGTTGATGVAASGATGVAAASGATQPSTSSGN